MKNILVVSATKKTNYQLAEKIKRILIDSNVEVTLISLEDFALPVYSDELYNNDKQEYISIIKTLTSYFTSSDGFVICGPEYNGCMHPIINNSIAWISVSTDYWKDAFKNKVSLVCSVSGGGGSKFLSTMKLQLKHLGSLPMDEHIAVNNSNPFNQEEGTKLLKQFINLIQIN